MTLSELNFYREEIAAEVHNAWWKEKESQGFHAPIECNNFKKVGLAKPYKFAGCCDRCHSGMYPYDELPEHVKEYDRVTVSAVLSAIGKYYDE